MLEGFRSFAQLFRVAVQEINAVRVEPERKRRCHVRRVVITGMGLVTPLGVGVQFPLTHWLAWRLEVVDNIAFSGEAFSAYARSRFGI